MHKYCLFGLLISANVITAAALPESSPYNLNELVEQARSIPFDKESSEAAVAYQFYCGLNILNAKDVDFVDGYRQGKCPIETLYGLFLALNSFFDLESARFVPEELNSG